MKSRRPSLARLCVVLGVLAPFLLAGVYGASIAPIGGTPTQPWWYAQGTTGNRCTSYTPGNSSAQLWSAATNTKTVVLDAILIGGGTAGGVINVGFVTSALGAPANDFTGVKSLAPNTACQAHIQSQGTAITLTVQTMQLIVPPAAAMLTVTNLGTTLPAGSGNGLALNSPTALNITWIWHEN